MALWTRALLAACALLSGVRAAVAPYEHAQLWNCTAGAVEQAWTVVAGVNATIALSNTFNSTKGAQLVLDLSDVVKASTLTALQYNSTAREEQGWVFTPSDGRIVNAASAGGQALLCLAALFNWPGAPVVLAACGATPSPLQTWAYDEGSGHVALVASFPPLCLDARTVIDCTHPSVAGALYCDPDAATSDRVADLVRRLEPEDFGTLLTSVGGVGVPRLGVPEEASSFGESLHGVWSNPGAPYTNASSGWSSSGDLTSFPHLGALAASFNRSLWAAVGDAIGTEAISLRNQHLDGRAVVASQYFSPDVNLFRYPTFGRGQEVPGECPHLSAEFVAVYAAALQGGPDSRYRRIVSTCKHYTAYDLEDLRPLGDNVTRFNFNANVTLGDLVEYYLPPFKSCAQRARTGAFMCSYNAVNGVPMCANGFLNNQILREEYGFTGMVISDCGAFSLICSPTCYAYNLGHNFTQTLNETVGVAVRGGLDAACDEQFGPAIPPAVANGSVALADLRTSAARFLTNVLSVGLMDPPSRVPYFDPATYGPQRIDTEEHRALAREAAVQSLVLLKNEGGVLPLRPATLRRVAVVGPNSVATQGLLSNYHGPSAVAGNQSVLAAVTRRGAGEGFTVSFALGCPSLSCPNTTGFAQAVAAVQGSDVALVVVGLCSQSCLAPEDERDTTAHEEEMADRTSLRLPGQQEALVQAIVATGVRVVLILIHGGPLDITWSQGNVPAILDAHYPGEMGGDAVAAVLFGDASPSGRLTVTVYPEAFIHQRDPRDMSLAPHDGVPGVTYMYYEGPVLWPFGYGQSYTTFAYTWLSDGLRDVFVDAGAWAVGGPPPAWAVNVTNTGAVPSDVSVLAFVSSSTPGQPLQELFDFQRAAAVQPGQTVTLFFAGAVDVMAHVSGEGVAALHPGTLTIRIGDVSAGQGHYVQGALHVTGASPATLFNASAARERYELKQAHESGRAAAAVLPPPPVAPHYPEPIVSVLQYGADPTGGVDAAPAIARALADLTARGGGGRAHRHASLPPRRVPHVALQRYAALHLHPPPGQRHAVGEHQL